MRRGERFDGFVADVDPAMVVVTTALAGETAGCLVGFHCQSSIDPPRYCVWLSKANRTTRLGVQATHLAVHLLAEDQREVARWFGTRTGDETDKLAGVAWRAGPGGVALLEDCPHRVVIRRLSVIDEGGDHVAVVGDVVVAERPGPLRPLRLSAVVDLAPGHDEHDRPSPPTERAR